MDSLTPKEKALSVTECLRLLRKAASAEGLTMYGDIGEGTYKPSLTVELWPALGTEKKERRIWR